METDNQGKLSNYFLTKRVTAVRLLIIVIISIFVAEILVMLFLPILKISSRYNAFVDSSLLIIIVFPILYFFFFRPMNLQRAELERTEELLREEKELLDTTLYSIGDGVISTDLSGRVIMVNNVAETLTGWTQAEAEGRPIQEVFHIVNAKTRERCNNPAMEAMETGAVVELANDTVLIAKDGTERFVADSGAAICNREGEIYGTILVFRDITE